MTDKIQIQLGTHAGALFEWYAMVHPSVRQLWGEEVMTMKISINAGHTASGAGYGAVYKGFRESEINRAVVAALIPKLKKLGHTIHNSTVDKATTINYVLLLNISGSNLENPCPPTQEANHKNNIPTIRITFQIG